MKKEKFVELWQIHAAEWHKGAFIRYQGESKPVSEFCNIKKNYGELVYKKYEAIKKLTKQLYFGDIDRRVNRFKRAAVIVYAINLTEPIEYINGYSEADIAVDKLLLKQRLAFHLGLHSIITQYPQDKVEQLCNSGDLFDFSIQSKGVGDENSDTFLEGIYKDIFFSGIYQNYNVLTMANVFLLITERSSRLSGFYNQPSVATHRKAEN